MEPCPWVLTIKIYCLLIGCSAVFKSLLLKAMWMNCLNISCSRSEMGSQFSAAANYSSSQHVFVSRKVVVQPWIFNEISRFGSIYLCFVKTVIAKRCASLYFSLQRARKVITNWPLESRGNLALNIRFLSDGDKRIFQGCRGMFYWRTGFSSHDVKS